MRNKKLFTLLNKHFEDNFWLYIVSILCVFTGVVIGIYTVKYMGQLQNNEIVTYLNSFVSVYGTNKFSNIDVFFEAVKNNLPVLVAIWFLGLTMIGVPIILIMDAIKGFTVGFTVSFIIKGLGVQGIWVSLLGVLPQNIIYIPCIIFGSVAAMEFSLLFLKSSMYKHWTRNVISKITAYSGLFIFIFIIMAVGFVIEAYLTPLLIKTVVISKWYMLC